MCNRSFSYILDFPFNLNEKQINNLLKYNLEDWATRMPELIKRTIQRLKARGPAAIVEVDSPTQLIENVTPIEELLLIELKPGPMFFDATGQPTDFLRFLNRYKDELVTQLESY